MSSIDDLIIFAHGLIPAGVTDSEEARKLEILVEEVKTDIARTKGILRDWREAHRLAYATGVNATKEAERVRRGARCLRDRCKRLQSRARGLEERADLASTAALYAWRMVLESPAPPFCRGAVLAEMHGAVATRYGQEFAERGRAARIAIDVLCGMREEGGR